MGGTYCIEPVCFQNTDLTLFALIVSTGSQNTVVMVEASASQQCLIAIDVQSVFIPCDLSDTERLFHDLNLSVVLFQDHHCRIKFRRLIAPELCIRNIKNNLITFS